MGREIAGMTGPVAPIGADLQADRAAVAELPRLYALGMDIRNLAMVLSLFDPDAPITGMLGTARAADYLPKLVAGLEPFATTMHSISNQYVVVDGDRANVWSYCRAYHVFKEPGRAHRIANLIYKDELTRLPGGWIIAAREAAHQWREGW